MTSRWLVPAVTAGSVLAYAGLYYSCRKWLAKERPPEFCCRVVTLAHGVSSVMLSAYCLYKGPWPFTAPDVPMTATQEWTLAHSLGYFMFDLVWCVCHNTEGLTMLAHHAFSIFTLCRALDKGVNGVECTTALGLLEKTNPLLQARWFMRSLGHQNTTEFYIVEGLFLLDFTIVRIVFGTVALKYMWRLEGSQRDVLYYGIGVYVISWCFFIGMVRYVRRKYLNPSLTRRGTESDE